MGNNLTSFNSQFLHHCHCNNLLEVKDCLSEGADVNTVSKDGLWSGLTIAAHTNNSDLLEILLSHPKIKINNTTDAEGALNSGQWTALMFACNAGNPSIVSRLVEVPEVDIMYQDNYDWTAADMASRKGHSECLRILGETGRVDWNRRNRRGCTPLFWALREGHSDCVEIIVQYSPDIDNSVKTKYDGYTVAHAAVRGGSTECVKTLASQTRCHCWNVPDKNGDTPLMVALKEGKTEIVEILVKCTRVDLKIKNKMDLTAEDIARERGLGSLLEGIQDSRVELREELNNVSDDIVNLLIENMEEREDIIKELEKELECNVCLETAQAPIYCCQEQHLVCGDCRPRIRETGKCPSCRVRYPGGELLRHRAAERTAVRLEIIREELRNLNTKLQNTNLIKPS